MNTIRIDEEKQWSVHICHTFYWSGNCEDAFVNAGGDLADTGLHGGVDVVGPS